MKKLYSWLLTSNRLKHLYVGSVLWVLWVLLGAAMSLSGIQIAITGFVMVYIAMCSVEFKDKAYGGAWDWLDILAGVLVPLAVLVFCLIYLLIFG